ncbi:MAG: hypothetical protein DRJ32_01895 [Thermoprotei archaeon]|nr:MAG: hypothetical protein DRJ32_01895 [Thermoprotei archaeon]
MSSILTGFRSNYASVKLRRIMRMTNIPPHYILPILHDIIAVVDKNGRTWVKIDIKGKNSRFNTHGKNVRIFFRQSNIY